MAADARSRFLEGLRVTADHLEHMQNRLRDSVLDLRRTVGLGRVAWGFKVNLGAAVALSPGVAFSPGGARLAVETPRTFPLPVGAGPWRVVLRVQESDQANLRLGGVPTLFLSTTTAALEPDDEADLGLDALVVARLSSDDGFSVEQDPSIFAAVGNHTHSGEFVQDEHGDWHFDGAPLDIELLPGPQGLRGETGPAGLPGPQGLKGDTGAAGPQGPAGTTGATGPAGPPGATGAIGPTGPAGATGAIGPAGPAGATGAIGPAGPAGATGAIGPAGPAGATGAQGPQGLTGATGSQGPQGLKGDTGAAGATGATGATGLTGPAGPVGPQGPAAPLEDYPYIDEINWPHDAPGSLALLEKLQVHLNSNMAERFLEVMPNLVQVWLEPFSDPFKPLSPTGLLTLHGTAFAEDKSVLSWTLSDDLELVQQAIPFGCRILVRIHLGTLYDSDERVYSASTEVILGVATPHLPGGVFESWFYVTQEGVRK